MQRLPLRHHRLMTMRCCRLWRTTSALCISRDCTKVLVANCVCMLVSMCVPSLFLIFLIVAMERVASLSRLGDCVINETRVVIVVRRWVYACIQCVVNSYRILITRQSRGWTVVVWYKAEKRVAIKREEQTNGCSTYLQERKRVRS